MVTEITSISPASGLVKGGTQVTVRGQNLGFMKYCKFGSVSFPASYIANDGSYVKCVSPAGTGTVTVQLSDTTKTDSIWMPMTPLKETLYTYYEPPRILSVNPSSGPATGEKQTRLQVNTGFLASKDLDKAACLFGTHVEKVVSYDCDSQTCYVTCHTPQLCFHIDPIEAIHCNTTTTQVYLSLNGQDFTTDARTNPTYTFDNTWTFPA
eukprot:c52410_g1_i1.p1 GENE.c52410_g1_i1~~c52410_g1_i1.p1  ORF type:complete len:236 (-),score=48.50 c52410_g1_i1:28-654(-)